MKAYRLSTLELRGTIERAFLPLRCTCTVAADNSLTVQIADPHSDRVDLFVTGISLDRLNTSRDICELVTELRFELANQGTLHGHVLPHAKAG
jgi:hypothetical protein